MQILNALKVLFLFTYIKKYFFFNPHILYDCNRLRNHYHSLYIGRYLIYVTHTSLAHKKQKFWLFQSEDDRVYFDLWVRKITARPIQKTDLVPYMKENFVFELFRIFYHLKYILVLHMSDYINAFEAFLGTPESDEKTPGPTSHSNGPPKGRAGVVVKAPSPQAEIPSTAIRKSTRRRRKKKIQSESSSGGESSESVSFRL